MLFDDEEGSVEDALRESVKGSLGDVLRERGRPGSGSEDIADIWGDQEKIRKEDAWLALEYKQAKERAKQIKKQLKQNQVGDEEILAAKLKESVETVLKTPLVSSLKSKLHTVKVPHKVRPALVVVWHKLCWLASSRRRLAVSAFVLIIVSLFGIRLFVGGAGKSNQGEQGGSTSEQHAASPSDVAGASVEKPPFTMLFPPDRSPSDFQPVKVSPEGNDPVFAYIDTFAGVQIRVSQQALPEAFKENPSGQLEKTAKDFQATSTIQVDETTVFHGLNEKTGIQSLIFIKNGLLIFVAAAQKIPDDQWVPFIAGIH